MSERPATAASIEIHRASNRWTDRRRAYRVLVDGRDLGAVRRGETARFELPAGAHEVFLKIDWCRSQKLAVDLEPGRSLRLECSARNPFAALYWISFGRNRYIQLARAPQLER